MFELGDPPDYEPAPSSSIQDRAEREGRTAEDVLYDVLLRGSAYLPALNYFEGNLDAVGEMRIHPYTVPGLGDGGAHVGFICDASFPTTLLSYWARDRQGTSRIDLPLAVQRQSRATTEAVGLNDRSLIARGYKADINVIDFDQLTPPQVRQRPSGGRPKGPPGHRWLPAHHRQRHRGLRRRQAHKPTPRKAGSGPEATGDRLSLNPPMNDLNH
jgi:N-acyl-D-aspartate/D-glutamate deacylase